MLIREASIAVIDFETTGAVPGFAEEPWQVGLAFVELGRFRPEYRLSQCLRVEAGRPFNAYAPGRHAALRQELALSPSLSELWPDLSPWLSGRAVAAHNIAVERKMLAQAFPLHRFGPWVDTLALARLAFPRAKSYALEDLMAALSLHGRAEQMCPGLGPHDAFYDAVGCALLLECLLELPKFARLELETSLV